jgi:hypothetical protein
MRFRREFVATRLVRFWNWALRPFGLEPIERGVTQQLVDEIDDLLREKETREARLRGLQEGIHAANETARRYAAKAHLAPMLDGQPCPMVAEVAYRRENRRVAFAAPCVRFGLHDEHRFELKEQDDPHGPVLITLRGAL